MSWLGLRVWVKKRKVFQRMQDLETVALKHLDRALLEVQSEIVLCWTRWTTSIGQVVDIRVLGRLHKWHGSEEGWPNWSLMKARDGAVDHQLSENMRIRSDVVSNGQFGGVQLCFVLIVLCTGRVWDRIADALRGQSTEAW